MIWGNERRICFLYAITPIHAGAGQALKAVDLPIQRERHTAWPMIQASGIKGSLRDWCEHAWNDDKDTKDKIEKIFGKSEGRGSSWAGALSVTDARILFFPVRSNVSPFVHITCPAVLKRFKNDLELIDAEDQKGNERKIPEIEDNMFISLSNDFPLDSVVLEDMLVTKKNGNNFTKWLSGVLGDVWSKLEKAIVVSDEVFGCLIRTATEVQAHIEIDDKTGTTKDGSLRYQEYLPADSVLYFLAFFSEERSGGNNSFSAEEVAKEVSSKVNTHIQLGGDFTLGKGICRVFWIEGR